MAFRWFLAMTAAEFHAADSLPDSVAWMACHFSPYGSGLTNLPDYLPPGSLLILNDRIPICGHDPRDISRQLWHTADQLQCSGILLDFQNTAAEELSQLSEHLVSARSCPVCVSEAYAEALDCPVFLPPCPHHIPLHDHIAPWKGREIWLDLAVNAETITVTKEGSQVRPLSMTEFPEKAHWDKHLHCHYTIESCKDSLQFTLWRTREDIELIAQDARDLGIQSMVSLYLEAQ